MSILDQLEDLERKATPGPWAKRKDWIEGGERGHDEVLGPSNVDCMTYCLGGSSRVEWGEGFRPDQCLIVAMRNALPALLRVARAARELTDCPDIYTVASARYVASLEVALAELTKEAT